MRRIKIIATLSLVIFFLGNINIIQAINKEAKIHKNVFVMSLDLSNLTKEEAKTKIDEELAKHSEIVLKYKDELYKININDLGIEYNTKQAIEEAFDIGRNKNLLENLNKKLKLDFGEKEVIKLTYRYNNEKINSFIDNISGQIYKAPVNASIKLENDKLVCKEGQNGLQIDKNKLKKDLMTNLKIMSLDHIEIVSEDIEPKYKYSELKSIDTILGTYKTYFNEKIINRANNIMVAADVTNNIIVNPSDEFSFNYYVDSEYALSRYKEAPIIINGKLEKGLGGGICQVSSTIYNAALYSDLKITSVKNHSIPSSYISKGRDATVANKNIDFKFENNFDTPILIVNKVENNSITTTIYGNSKHKKEISIVTEIEKYLPNKVKIKNSYELYEDEKIVETKGRKGYIVNTFRVYKEKKEFINKSYYPPEDKVIIKGVKKRESYNMDTEII